MKISYWMILVASLYSYKDLIKNSEHCSLFLRKATVQIIYVVCSVFLIACQPGSIAETVIFTGPTMGTDYRVTLVVPSQYRYDHLESKILAQLESVNASMSNYLDDSEVSQINRLQVNHQLRLSTSTLEVISEAMHISDLSDGAFDITVGKAVKLWGFGADGEVNKRPTIEQLNALKTSVGYQNLRLQGSVISKQHSDTEIDLSAIAKGYAVDQIAKLLDLEDINNYLINVGGELRAKGHNSNHQVWRIAIEKPVELGGIQQIIVLQDKAIATSGDYRNYIVFNGKRYSHTIDPETLEPVLHHLALVSVISDRTSTADALATALMSMGEESALEFAKDQGLAAYFVIRTEDETKFEVSYTQNFIPYLQ